MIAPRMIARSKAVRWSFSIGICALLAFVVLIAATAQAPQQAAQTSQLLVPTPRGKTSPLIQKQRVSLPVESVMVKLQPGVSPDELVLRYNATVPVAQVAGKAEAVPVPQAPALTYLRSNTETGWHVIRLRDPADLNKTLDALRKQPGVLLAQPNYRAKLLLAPPNDTYYGQQNWQHLIVVLSQIDFDKNSAIQDDVAYWNYTWSQEIINSLQAWSVFPGKYYTSSDRTSPNTYLPKVGIIDTGVDMTHPDFSLTGNPNGSQFTYDYYDESTPDPNGTFLTATHDTNVKYGGQIAVDLARSFISGEYPLDAKGNPNYNAGDPKWAIDGFGHGTSCGGIIAAAANKGFGVPGVGFCSQLVPLKAIDNNGSGTEDEIEAAMIYAANKGCVAVNMSLALDTTDYPQAMQDTVNYCWKKGCLVIAAAGNDNDSTHPILGATRRYPANCQRVLAVAASAYGSPGFDHISPGTTLQSEVPASYSNYGPNIGVIAPGGDVTYFNDPTEILELLALNPCPQYVLPFTLAPTYMAALSDSTNPEGLYFGLFLYGCDQFGNRMPYGAIPGTSLATPHVTGLAGLYAAKYYAALAAQHKKTVPPTPQQMINAIERGAINTGNRIDGGVSSPSTTGYGRIDAEATVKELNARNATVGGLVGQVMIADTIQANVKVTAQRSSRNQVVVGSKIFAATTGPDGIFRLPNLPTNNSAPFTYSVSVTINYIGMVGLKPKVMKVTKTLPSVLVVPGCDQHGTDLIF